jgi:hypothetical protein
VVRQPGLHGRRPQGCATVPDRLCSGGRVAPDTEIDGERSGRSAWSWNTGLSAAREDMPRKPGTESAGANYDRRIGSNPRHPVGRTVRVGRCLSLGEVLLVGRVG